MDPGKVDGRPLLGPTVGPGETDDKNERRVPEQYRPVFDDDDVEKDRQGAVSTSGEEDDVSPSTGTLSSTADRPTGSGVGAMFNIANTALGAGILAFPYAFKESGLALGLILVVVVAGLCAFSQEMVVMGMLECKDKEYRGGPRVNSYDGMVRSLLGPFWGTTMEVLIAIYQFGACVAYVLVACDQLQPLLKCVVCGGACCHSVPIDSDSDCECSNAFCSRTIIVLFCTWALMFPPCLLHDVSKLKWVSVIGVACPFLMSAIIVFFGIEDVVKNGATVDFGNVDWFSGDLKSCFVALPIFCFALQSHISVPCIFNGCRPELQNKKDFGWVIFAAYALILCLYIPTGAFGLTYFLENLPGDGDFPKDVLTGFKTNKVLADVARVCMAASAMCSYPLNHFPARCAIFNVLFKKKSVDEMENKNTIYRVEAVVFNVCACALAIAVPNVATVFGVLGATVASAAMFIFPGLVLYHYVVAHEYVFGSPELSARSPHLTPIQRERSTFDLPKTCNTSVALGLGYIAIGILIAVIGTYASLL